MSIEMVVCRVSLVRAMVSNSYACSSSIVKNFELIPTEVMIE
jgi:hypothetical protein